MCSVCVLRTTATTGISTLSLHDALPIFVACVVFEVARHVNDPQLGPQALEPFGELGSSHLGHHDIGKQQMDRLVRDRKSTRLNSSHTVSSYAVFCLKKKNERYALCRPRQ